MVCCPSYIIPGNFPRWLDLVFILCVGFLYCDNVNLFLLKFRVNKGTLLDLCDSYMANAYEQFFFQEMPTQFPWVVSTYKWVKRHSRLTWVVTNSKIIFVWFLIKIISNEKIMHENEWKFPLNKKYANVYLQGTGVF